jgi:hypothetical protein
MNTSIVITLNSLNPMRKLILLLTVAFLLFSCENEKLDEDLIIGEWELVEIYNPWTGTSSSENVKDNFQAYKFMSDGTFKKTRKSEGENLMEATGVYALEKVPAYSSSDAKLHINLTFTSGDDIYSNCGEPNQEQLTLRFNNLLNNFSMTSCDGPGFTFEKK